MHRFGLWLCAIVCGLALAAGASAHTTTSSSGVVRGVAAGDSLPNPARATAAVRRCIRLAPRARRAEARRQRIERVTIGATHAREHALARTQARVQRCLAKAHSGARRPDGAAVASGRATARDGGALASGNAIADDSGLTSLAAGSPSQVGRWSAPAFLEIVAIHAVVVPTGEILFFTYDPDQVDGWALLWNPTTGQGVRVDPPSNLWCAGQVLLADGRVLVVGGNLAFPQGNLSYKGLDEIWIFNPWTRTWRFEGRMRKGRWYPTTTRLADNRVVITSGWDETGTRTYDPDVEVYTPSSVPNQSGTISVVSSRVFRGLYPHQQLLPNGHVLIGGPGKTDPATLNPSTWTWSDLPDSSSMHQGYAPQVPLPGPPSGSWSMMIFGGGPSPFYSGAVNESIDASNPGAGWTTRTPLPQTRRNHNAVLLPDGDILLVGGNERYLREAPTREALLYRPSIDQLAAMAEQAENRDYHSTALLLPDGRVLSAGGDGPASGGATTDTYEIFEPTYLFRGTRPAITSAPASTDWGEGFQIGTDAPVTRAVLMSPAATTHANDMNQRHIELAATPNAGGIAVVGPPSAAVAVEGWYMLFVLDADGVPSTSRWIKVGSPSAADTTAPTLAGRAPAPGALDVAVSADVAATFSEPIDPTTVNAGSFNLAPVAGGPAVAATISASAGDTVFTLDPGADLAAGTAYRASVTTAVEDVAGNALQSTQTWEFTTAPANPGPGPFLEQSGQVVIEAESFSANVPRSGKSWAAPTSTPAGVVQSALQVLPNSGSAIDTGYATTSPQLSFPVSFQTPGTYRVWIRGYAASAGDDSLHAGLDGAAVASADRLTTGGSGVLKWFVATLDSPVATIPVPSAGVRTLDLWMREDGLIVDRVLLTTSTSFIPSGAGPAESPRAS